jgi:hypothetical protein
MNWKRSKSKIYNLSLFRFTRFQKQKLEAVTNLESQMYAKIDIQLEFQKIMSLLEAVDPLEIPSHKNDISKLMNFCELKQLKEFDDNAHMFVVRDREYNKNDLKSMEEACHVYAQNFVYMADIKSRFEREHERVSKEFASLVTKMTSRKHDAARCLENFNAEMSEVESKCYTLERQMTQLLQNPNGNKRTRVCTQNLDIASMCIQIHSKDPKIADVLQEYEECIAQNETITERATKQKQLLDYLHGLVDFCGKLDLELCARKEISAYNFQTKEDTFVATNTKLIFEKLFPDLFQLIDNLTPAEEQKVALTKTNLAKHEDELRRLDQNYAENECRSERDGLIRKITDLNIVLNNCKNKREKMEYLAMEFWNRKDIPAQIRTFLSTCKVHKSHLPPHVIHSEAFKEPLFETKEEVQSPEQKHASQPEAPKEVRVDKQIICVVQ